MTEVESTYAIGSPVRMTWAGGTRDGVVVGVEYPDSLPTGARFIPVEWSDGSRDSVDTRVLTATAGEPECVCFSGLLGFPVHRPGCPLSVPERGSAGRRSTAYSSRSSGAGQGSGLRPTPDSPDTIEVAGRG
jgi:hypothetical protein